MALSTIQKLDKTLKSINNHICRGNYIINHQRAYELHDRYELLREKAIQEDVWDKYCDNHNFSACHNASDCWS
jgi:hypothetical protein